VNITENCLKYLQTKEWLKLNQLLSDEKNCKELATDPIFSVFEMNLIREVQRYENDGNENLSTVLVRIFHLNQNLGILKLSENCVLELAEYLFQKHPSDQYAKILTENSEAQQFLKNKSSELTEKIEKTLLASNLNVKIGTSGNLDFSKSIFNSPQEKELYLASKRILKDEILLPNIALSTVINSKVIVLLQNKTRSFFFQSTLDLCIVDSQTFIPKFFIELDSSWHDKPKQIENDRMKNEIFEKAGLELHRIRKKENKSMDEIFELYIKKNYVC
jgi:very-short-patch-repair endonuclease